MLRYLPNHLCAPDIARELASSTVPDALMAPLIQHYGIQLWMPEAGAQSAGTRMANSRGVAYAAPEAGTNFEHQLHPGRRATSLIRICCRPGEAFIRPRRQSAQPVERGCSRWDMGQAADGVYTARVAGYQDELAEFRAAPEAVADVLRDSLSPASGMPGMMSWAELARLPAVTPGRPSCLVRDGRKHPGSGHG